MTAPVFVVDTNVLAAGLITGDGQSPVARIVDAMLTGRLHYVLSPALVAEYRSVLLRPKLANLHRSLFARRLILIPALPVGTERAYLYNSTDR